MPRCISSTSPDDKSASRYLARRPMPVTHSPRSRKAKLFGNGKRRSGRRTSTFTKRAFSITGCSPRRTVSTSGSSGIGSCLVGDRVCPLAKRDPIVERIGYRQLRHAPVLLLQPGPIVAIFLVDQLAMQGLNAGHVNINDRTRRAVTVVLAKIDCKPASGDLHEYRRIRLEAVLP